MHERYSMLRLGLRRARMIIRTGCPGRRRPSRLSISAQMRTWPVIGSTSGLTNEILPSKVAACRLARSSVSRTGCTEQLGVGTAAGRKPSALSRSTFTIRTAFGPLRPIRPAGRRSARSCRRTGATIRRRPTLDLGGVEFVFLADFISSTAICRLWSACSASSRVFSTLSRSTSSSDCDTLLAKRSIDSVDRCELRDRHLGRFLGEADLHVVRRLRVGDVVFELGVPFCHARDLIVDLREQFAFLHASPSRTATFVSTPASCAGTSASSISRNTTD